MKKLFTLVMSMTLVIFSSCLKESTCKCVESNPTNPPGVTVSGTTTFNIQGTTKHAEKECQGHSSGPDQYGNRTDCALE